jgi:hypothetical protein
MTLHSRTLAALLVLSLAAGVASADEDSKSGGDLQPVTPIGRYQLPFFQNYRQDGFCYALASDGRSVVMTSHGPLTVYDLTPSRQPNNTVRQLMVENAYFNQGAVAFSPDGKTVAAVGPGPFRSPGKVDDAEPQSFSSLTFLHSTAEPSSVAGPAC